MKLLSRIGIFRKRRTGFFPAEVQLKETEFFHRHFGFGLVIFKIV